MLKHLVYTRAGDTPAERFETAALAAKSLDARRVWKGSKGEGSVFLDDSEPNDIRYCAASPFTGELLPCHSLSGAIGWLEIVAARFDKRAIT